MLATLLTITAFCYLVIQAYILTDKYDKGKWLSDPERTCGPFKDTKYTVQAME